MGTPARQRLEEVGGRWRLCDVQGCQRQTQKWGKYCEAHDNTNERTGHPDGYTVRVSTLKPYLDMASEFIRDHKGHPAIQAALRWLVVLVYCDRPPVNHLGQNAPPHLRVNRWLDKMKKQGIRPEEMLAMIAAFYLLREDHPRDFKSDRHFNHQLVVRFLRMIRAPWSERWAEGKPYRRYDRVTVKVRELLSRQINEALGLMCLRMARAILRPNPLEGIETPFETTRTKEYT